MIKFTNTHGEYQLDEDGVLYINGKEKFRNVTDISYQASRRDTYIYIHFEKDFYRIYSLKQRKTILSNISKILYKSKSIFIVKFQKENNDEKEKCYLFDLNDDGKCRYILNFVGQYILELDGKTLTNVKQGKPPILLPEKCKDLCKPKETLEFFAITENDEVLTLIPYQYENLKSYDTSSIRFLKFKKYAKYEKLIKLSYKDLIDYISFKNEEEKYLFALTNILSIYITDETNCNKIIIKNLKTFLEDKKVVLKIGRLKIFLTLDKVLIKEIGNITEFDYDIFEFNDAYLQNLVSYYNVKEIEARIKYFSNRKMPIDKILNLPDFLDKSDLLKHYLFCLNCNPNGNIFYIINNKKQLVMVNRINFINLLIKTIKEGKSFELLLKRYNVEKNLIKTLIKKISPDDYNTLKQKHMFNK